MNDDIAKRLVERLRLMPPFARLPVTNRPMEDLWQALDQTSSAMRLPLYFRRLGKSSPRRRPMRSRSNPRSPFSKPSQR